MNIINIEHISKIFGEKVIFDDTSFGIHAGDKIGIVGINGTGKTTLLKMIAGLEEPDTGQIIKQNNLKIAYLTQNPDFPKGATVAEYALSGEADINWKVQSNLLELGVNEPDSLLEHLSPREKKVIFLRFGLINEQSHNLDECGKILNLTPERVRQIESIALNKIRKMKNCNNLRSMFQNK